MRPSSLNSSCVRIELPFAWPLWEWKTHSINNLRFHGSPEGCGQKRRTVGLRAGGEEEEGARLGHRGEAGVGGGEGGYWPLGESGGVHSGRS